MNEEKSVKSHTYFLCKPTIFGKKSINYAQAKYIYRTKIVLAVDEFVMVKCDILKLRCGQEGGGTVGIPRQISLNLFAKIVFLNTCSYQFTSGRKTLKFLWSFRDEHVIIYLIRQYVGHLWVVRLNLKCVCLYWNISTWWAHLFSLDHCVHSH